VAVRCPRVRDRVGEGCERIRFSSAILPPYARRSKSLEVLIPILYLKGVSTGDFEEALLALLGKDAGGLSASTIGRLKDAWSDEPTRWSKRDLSVKRYADTSGSTASTCRPASRTTRSACWLSSVRRRRAKKNSSASSTACARVHTPGRSCSSTSNASRDGPPTRGYRRRPRLLAETKKDALAAFDAFVETWGVKYDKAVECLTKDRDALLAFYDFPAEHWKHLRTTNVIESSFATVRHRTVRSKGCLSNKTALAWIFKLAEAAEKNWRRLDGHNQLPKVVLGVKFTDGVEVLRSQAQVAAA
jgi:putative transposase